MGLPEGSDPAERLGGRARAWAAQHPALLGRLRTVWAVSSWASLAALVAGLLFVPSLRKGFGPWAWCYYALVVWFLLARSKTLTWRFVALTFTAGCVLAPVIGIVEVVAAGLIGADINGQDGAVLVAGPVEEALKLLPLFAVLAFARNRARRMAATDFLLIGFASGAAFQAVEDAIRRLALTAARPGLLDFLAPTASDPGSGYPQYHLGLLPGWSRQHHAAYFAGHHVLTALVAVGIGLAWHSRHRWGPRLWALPAGLFVMVVLDHALNNNHGTVTGGSHVVDVPGWVKAPWDAWGNGAFERPLLYLLLVVALVVDARRTAAVADRLPPVPAAASGGQYVNELAVIALCVPGGRWARTVAYLRLRREVAQELSHRADRPARRPPPAAAAAVVIGALLGLGLVVAAHIGLPHPPAFLANLFDNLADWWKGLGGWKQLLVIAALAGLLTLGGVGLLPAIGMAGTATDLISKGAGIADFIRDPRKATTNFVTRLTPGQVLGYGVDYAMGRMVPAALGGAVGRAVRREIRDASDVLDDPRAFRRWWAERFDETGAARVPGGGVGDAVPTNRALFEQYKAELRATMQRPHVEDSDLGRIMGRLWRPDATVGSGSTAAAVREELATGVPVKGLFHSQKAADSMTRLERWLRTHPDAAPGDRAAAENAILDLRAALEGG